MERVEVKNVADEKQVKRAAKRMESREDREVNDIRYVLNDKRGRRFLWRLLNECKVFESIWVPSAGIHYNAGKQDVGHFLMAEIVKASEDAYLLMTKEAKLAKENMDV